MQDLLSCKAELDAKISRVEVELSALREKVSFFSVIYGKFDETLSKVQELMEDRRNETNDDLKDVYKKIQDTENKIMNEIHLMREEMKKQHDLERKKIGDLDKWRWFIMGAAAIVGWLISRMVQLVN